MYTTFMPAVPTYNPYLTYQNPYYQNQNLSLTRVQPDQNIYIPNMPVYRPYPAANKDTYTVMRNREDGSINILYDDKNINDEESTFIFRTDGSASSMSHAWRSRTDYPAGTFSAMMAILKNQEITSEIAEQMVNEFYNKGNKSS